MKRKIQLITLICCTLIFGACDSWLDVKPYDQIAEEDLLNSEAGFQKLLNGVYIELNDENLYGSTLMVEMLELMGGAYKIGDDQGKWGDYIDLNSYKYSTEYWRGRLDKVWEKAYALIMNCNKILDNIENRESLFTGINYDIIRGEALALRAMLHFDMLRLFGPVYMNNPENECIPYYLYQSSNVNDLLPANKVMEYVIHDLQEAEKALANDPIITKGTLMESAGNESNFLRYRALRMNYYAVQGLMARVYLYAGDKSNASIYAKKVITAAEAGTFPFTERTEVKSDRIFSSEVLFALTNTNRVLLFKNYYDPSRNPSFIFTMDEKLLNFLYSASGSSTTSDTRFEANWEQATLPGLTSGARYFYKYNDMSTTGLIQNTMIPMLRLGEMYLIAAESESETLNDGLPYINTLRNKRGISNLGSLTVTDLTYEYMRELYGEGQLFYFYKRTFTTILNRTNSSGSRPAGQAASTQVFVVPFPDTEINNRQ